MAHFETVFSCLQELIFVQSDFSRRQTDFLAQLRDRDQELESLRTPGYDGSASGYQAAGGGGGGGGGGGSGGGGGGGGENNPDLEERISQLTESLLQKQALLEAISAEKTALVFQVERMQVGSPGIMSWSPEACTSFVPAR